MYFLRYVHLLLCLLVSVCLFEHVPVCMCVCVRVCVCVCVCGLIVNYSFFSCSEYRLNHEGNW